MSSQEDFSNWENLKFELFILLSVLETVTQKYLLRTECGGMGLYSQEIEAGEPLGNVFIASTRPARAME